jgi:hypothetical protein
MKLFVTPGQDRYFLLPEDCSIPSGHMLLVSIDGERHVDAAAVRPYEATWEQVDSHVRDEVERNVTDAIDMLAAALRLTDGEQLSPTVLAERLGVTATSQRAASTLRDLAADVEAVAAAVTSGQPAIPRRLRQEGFGQE